MKKVGISGIFFLLMACGLAAAEFLDGSDIKTDVVQTANKRVGGVISRENFLNTTVKNDKNDIKVPHSVIVAVYYKGTDNEAMSGGYTCFRDKKYSEALANFETAEKSAKELSDNVRPYFLERINYYKGLCCYYLGDYAGAEKFLNSALRREDAIYKFEGEYYVGRILEAKGAYDKANSKFSSVLSVVYPKLLENKPAGAEKWVYLSTLGKARTQVLQLSTKANQDSKISEAAEAFKKTFAEGTEKKYIDDELKMGGIQIEACALKYLAKKNPANFEKLIEALGTPLRDAAAANDKNNLPWMYLDRADCYFGLMENSKDDAKKKEYGEAALLDYMRVAYGYTAVPADLGRALYRIGLLCQQLQVNDWEQRALTHFRRATGAAYKATPTFDAAMKARKELEEKTAAAEDKNKAK